MGESADVPAASGEIVVATDSGAYRSGLSLRKRRLEQELAAADESEAITLNRRLSILAEAAAEENFETSFLGHRGRVIEAESALTEFLGRFDPEQRWEAQYALRTGDLELVASAVSAAAAEVEDQPEAAENAAAEVLIRLGRLAAAGFEFDMAERLLRSGIEQFSNQAVKARALAAYAEMLRSENRNREAREVEYQQSQVLQE